MNAVTLGQLVRRTDPYYTPTPTLENARAVTQVENPARGLVVAVTESRVRVQWFKLDGTEKNRTWMSVKQYGKTWALA